jgi:hypothetical protein
MSRGQGGYIGFNRVPAAAAINSAASGVWTLREAEALRRAGTWPVVAPGGVSTGLQLWLDASDASTLYDATTGGSLVAADGGVARWEDKSGNARHATQATSANRPLRKTNQQNGLNALLFDGSNDAFSLSSITIPNSHSVFQVYQRLTGVQSFGIAHNNNNNVRYASLWFTDGILYQISNEPNNFTTHGGSNAATGYFVVSTIRNATTSIDVRRNGSSVASVTTGAGVTNAASGSWNAIGDRSSGFFHSGNLCEIIVYDSALSSTDRAAVETYLLAKWGIT